MINKKTIISVLISLILFPAYQINTQEEKIQFKVEVKEKLLYVLALDKKGNPITDLKKEGFQLFVNGQPQKIETFALIRHIDKKRVPETEETIDKKIELPDITIEEKKANRRFILAVIPSHIEIDNIFKDDSQELEETLTKQAELGGEYKLTINEIYRRRLTKEALELLIEQARFPEDWIGIVAVNLYSIIGIQDFTNSKEKLHQKVDAYFKHDIEQIRTLNAQYPVTAVESSQVPQLPIFQGRIPVHGGFDTGPALNSLAEKMGLLRGRKVMLCFGTHVNMFGGVNRTAEFFDMINNMIFHNITIYYFEFKKPFIPTSVLDQRPKINSQSKYVKHLLQRFSGESSHFALANETGGKYYYNISSPTYCINDVNKINRSYYLISFPITEELGKKKSHIIKLKCKRKGAKLFYGNKYYAPHELKDKQFADIYKKTELYKHLFLEIKERSTLKLFGQWIPLFKDENNLHIGYIDYYLPQMFLQNLPKSYLLGCSYKNEQEKGVVFQDEINFNPTKQEHETVSHGYALRVLGKLPERQKSLRLVVMESDSGEYGKIDIDMGRYPESEEPIKIILGRLLGKGRFYEYKDFSKEQYNIKKELYNLLSINDFLIVPSGNNVFRWGEEVTFCLIQKIPEKECKKYKNQKVVAHLASDKEGEISDSNPPVHIKKIGKDYYQYYGTINTDDLTPRKYRIEIDLKDAKILLSPPLIRTSK